MFDSFYYCLFPHDLYDEENTIPSKIIPFNSLEPSIIKEQLNQLVVEHNKTFLLRDRTKYYQFLKAMEIYLDKVLDKFIIKFQLA